jgi:hypothetical protein
MLYMRPPFFDVLSQFIVAVVAVLVERHAMRTLFRFAPWTGSDTADAARETAVTGKLSHFAARLGLPHRAAAPFLPITDSCFGVSAAALAFPPNRPACFVVVMLLKIYLAIATVKSYLLSERKKLGRLFGRVFVRVEGGAAGQW